MKNYEAIKKMDVEELAEVFLAFVNPFAGDMKPQEKAEFKEKIIAFLNKEIEK